MMTHVEAEPDVLCDSEGVEEGAVLEDEAQLGRLAAEAKTTSAAFRERLGAAAVD